MKNGEMMMVKSRIEKAEVIEIGGGGNCLR